MVPPANVAIIPLRLYSEKECAGIGPNFWAYHRVEAASLPPEVFTACVRQGWRTYKPVRVR